MFIVLFFFLFLFYHYNHAAARCSQDGIIRENVCAAYFSQGLSLTNYCLDGSQRFSPITCIFLVWCVDGSQGSTRTVSALLSLATVSAVSGEEAHGGTFLPMLHCERCQRKGHGLYGGGVGGGHTTCPASLQTGRICTVHPGISPLLNTVLCAAHCVRLVQSKAQTFFILIFFYRRYRVFFSICTFYSS